jgi:hypothetical protein
VFLLANLKDLLNLDPSDQQNSSNRAPSQPLLPPPLQPPLPPSLLQLRPQLLRPSLLNLSALLQPHLVALLPSSRLLLLPSTNNSNSITSSSNSVVQVEAVLLVPSSRLPLLCLKALDLTPNLWQLHSYCHLEHLLPTPRLICSTTLPCLLNNILPVASVKLANILGLTMEPLPKVETCLQVLVALSLLCPACLFLPLPLR